MKDSKRGAVMVLVLLMLVSLIVIGIVLYHNSMISLRIIGNEKKFSTDFYAIDSAVTWFLENPDPVLNSIDSAFEADKTLTKWKEVKSSALPNITMPDGKLMSDKVKLEIALEKKGTPQPGSKMGVGHTITYYFHARATDKDSGRQVKAGVWKAYPKD